MLSTPFSTSLFCLINTTSVNICSHRSSLGGFKYDRQSWINIEGTNLFSKIIIWRGESITIVFKVIRTFSWNPPGQVTFVSLNQLQTWDICITWNQNRIIFYLLTCDHKALPWEFCRVSDPCCSAESLDKYEPRTLLWS